MFFHIFEDFHDVRLIKSLTIPKYILVIRKKALKQSWIMIQWYLQGIYLENVLCELHIAAIRMSHKARRNFFTPPLVHL